MNVFVVLAHPEPLSFNGSMFRLAVDVLMRAGHEVKASDLYAMQFDPVSGRSALVVRSARNSKGLGRSSVCDGPYLRRR